MKVRYAKPADQSWLESADHHVKKTWVQRCLNHQEYIVAEDDDGTPQGFLRFSYFWSDIPYMDMIRVTDGQRKKGYGTAMFSFWEAEMCKQGANVLMTSSCLSETEPQTWHKRNGFEESGQLTFGQHEPEPELFLIKNL